MNKAENALSAKAHALYAKRLTDSDYTELINCRTNQELFSHLKAVPAYGEYLEALPSVRLSRARFETAMKQANLDRIASLCRFEKLIGEKLYRYFIMKNEVETILYCARHLDTEEITDLFILPDFYKKEQVVHGEVLQKATSFSELSALLDGTPYKKLLSPIVASQSGVNLAVLENVLYNYLYSTASEMVKKGFKGKAREEILNYFRFHSDMMMISAFCRLHRNYSSSDNYKGNLFISNVTAFSDKQLSSLIDSDSEEEVMKIVRSSPYKKFFPENDSVPVVRRVRTATVQMSVKNLRYSRNPIVCMLCYFTIAENEIKNITHIIEGIKYNLSPDEISEIIVKGEG